MNAADTRPRLPELRALLAVELGLSSDSIGRIERALRADVVTGALIGRAAGGRGGGAVATPQAAATLLLGAAVGGDLATLPARVADFVSSVWAGSRPVAVVFERGDGGVVPVEEPNLEKCSLTGTTNAFSAVRNVLADEAVAARVLRAEVFCDAPELHVIFSDGPEVLRGVFRYAFGRSRARRRGRRLTQIQGSLICDLAAMVAASTEGDNQ